MSIEKLIQSNLNATAAWNAFGPHIEAFLDIVRRVDGRGA